VEETWSKLVGEKWRGGRSGGQEHGGGGEHGVVGAAAIGGVGVCEDRRSDMLSHRIGAAQQVAKGRGTSRTRVKEQGQMRGGGGRKRQPERRLKSGERCRQCADARVAAA